MALTSNTYKALIATTLLSSAVVFLGFTMHINKKSEFIAETFYDLEPENLEDESPQEELEDIIESLDKLLSESTNQAYNETKKYEAPDDKAFNERLEEIQNRNNPDNNPEASETETSSSGQSKTDTEDNSEFSKINDLISEKKRAAASGEINVNKNSSISYSLTNRTKTHIPPPVYLCQKGGKIIVNITVNSNGIVTDAYFNNASSSKDGCMVDHALEYAKAARFNADASKNSQLGSITFYFKGK